jgi:site-specific recombinase XerD
VTRPPLFCERCGTKGRRYRHGLCGPCALAIELRAELDDGTGAIRPELQPFADGFARMRNPRAGISWLARPHVHAMLRHLADPATTITHETLDSMTPWRSVAYLRDLLMLHGVLPPCDRHLMLFARWLRDTLNHVGDTEHRRVVERFAVWHVQRRLRQFADRGPVTDKQTQQARREVRQAVAFLAWLQDQGRTLSTCRQADIDGWYSGAYTARRLTHSFLRWAMCAKLIAQLHIPHQHTRNPAPISQRQRVDLIRRLITSDDIPLPTRTSALLMLLYAQPLTRILRLTIDDVLSGDDEISIKVGDPPSPVPEPVAGLLLAHISNRHNLTTATNRDARWLFPGRRAGQPLTVNAVERQLHQHQIPGLTGRTSAIRHLVLQTPAPVVARMLSYTYDQTARLAAETGAPWSRYSPRNRS